MDEKLKATLLSKPGMYHYLRQGLTGGMPFRRWIDLYGFNDPHHGSWDLGCGPADMLRYIGSPLPEFYLGVDLSTPYLEAGTKRGGKCSGRCEVRADGPRPSVS